MLWKSFRTWWSKSCGGYEVGIADPIVSFEANPWREIPRWFQCTQAPGLGPIHGRSQCVAHCLWLDSAKPSQGASNFDRVLATLQSIASWASALHIGWCRLEQVLHLCCCTGMKGEEEREQLFWCVLGIQSSVLEPKLPTEPANTIHICPWSSITQEVRTPTDSWLRSSRKCAGTKLPCRTSWGSLRLMVRTCFRKGWLIGMVSDTLQLASIPSAIGSGWWRQGTFQGPLPMWKSAREGSTQTPGASVISAMLARSMCLLKIYVLVESVRGERPCFKAALLRQCLLCCSCLTSQSVNLHILLSTSGTATI